VIVSCYLQEALPAPGVLSSFFSKQETPPELEVWSKTVFVCGDVFPAWSNLESPQMV
jgi:hypothetical protein